MSLHLNAQINMYTYMYIVCVRWTIHVACNAPNQLCMKSTYLSHGWPLKSIFMSTTTIVTPIKLGKKYFLTKI